MYIQIVMKMRSVTIPLFPLRVVLFPTVPLPLHIFEERYRIMINNCIDEQEPFGVVYHRGDQIETVGCTAVVNHVINRYDDGRMDIVVLGSERFRVEEFDESELYLQARVTILGDNPSNGEPIEEQQLRSRAIERLLSYAQLSELDLEEGSLTGLNANQLSFLISGVDSLPLETKQDLLQLDSATERLERSVVAIDRVVERLRLFERIRQAAGAEIDIKSMLN